MTDYLFYRGRRVTAAEYEAFSEKERKRSERYRAARKHKCREQNCPEMVDGRAERCPYHATLKRWEKRRAGKA